MSCVSLQRDLMLPAFGSDWVSPGEKTLSGNLQSFDQEGDEELAVKPGFGALRLYLVKTP